ncbi:MAG: hypothetical protein IH948_08840, partial [Bacteroidetes bacterium]|nr:hypothetical protein [Bacteroidota bacterium]
IMNTPKQRALERIKHILDVVEELRHSNPSGTNSFEIHAEKLTYGAVTLREFDSLLKKIESEGVAKLIHHTNGYGGGWGEEPVEIINVDWNRFDKYHKEIKKELEGGIYNKVLNFNLRDLVNLLLTPYRLAKWLVKIIKNHKFWSIFITISTLLAVDYSLAWKNIKALARLFGIEM